MTTNVIGALDFDEDPAIWHVTIDGWDSTSEGTAQSQQRINATGAFRDVNHGTAKDMVLRGSVRVASPDLLEAALDRLKVACSLEPTTLSRSKFGRRLSMTVHRQGDVDIPPLPTPYARFFTCQLKADDPFKYGDPVTASTGLPSSGGGLLFPVFDGTGFAEFGEPGASGQVTLSNVGTAEAWPVFTITGPVIGGVVLTDVDSGNRIVYSGNVPGGATLLIIDSAFGRATLNAADRTGELTVKQWFSVPPGGSVTVQFATLGTSGQAGQLNPASLTPAYW